MESVTFSFFDTKYRAINSLDNDLGILCSYISDGVIWFNLIDPDVISNAYGCGNFYCTKQDEINLYISDFVTLGKYPEENDDELGPVIINLNTMLGILVAFEQISQHIPKIQQFIMTKDDQRYIFTSDSLVEAIVVDPDLGNLYNETIPYIIKRRSNDSVVKSQNNSASPFSFYKHSDAELRLLCDVIKPEYCSNLLYNVCNWPNAFEDISSSVQFFVHNEIKISNWHDSVTIKNNLTELSVTKKSLIRFLHAWESRLQFCESFTLVLLGQTLRFFEGEPMPVD